MKVSTKGRYAVMALVDIAVNGGSLQGANQGGAHPVSLADVAQRQDISLSYLEQLFSRLRRAGLVRSVRGPGGGYLLARPAGTIAIAEVVQAVEEEQRPLIQAGTQAGGAVISARALTQALWDSLGKQIRSYLAGVTLADVVGAGQAEHRATPADKRSAA
jgi:Rrf2 family iron-sulfur cluster assembly transcriptional regulator